MSKAISHNDIVRVAGDPLTQDEAMKKLLELMIAFDKFCEEHDLRYWLAGGTLLGAIRHQGFIPWDDDADIMMPRADYNKLMSFKKINEDIDIVSVQNDNGYYHPFVITKISDRDTISIIQDSDRNTGRGQFVDIFPLDNIPDDVDVRNRFFFKLNRYHKIRTLAIRKIGKGNGLKIHIVNAITRLLRPFSGLNYMRKIDKLAQKYSSSRTAKWGLLCHSVSDVLQWNTKDFDETIRVPFEGKMFCVPAGAKNVLTHQYGDYMQLPPENQRIGKHDMKIYWKSKRRP